MVYSFFCIRQSVYPVFKNCRKSMINGTGIKTLCVQELSAVYMHSLYFRKINFTILSNDAARQQPTGSPDSAIPTRSSHPYTGCPQTVQSGFLPVFLLYVPHSGSWPSQKSEYHKASAPHTPRSVSFLSQAEFSQSTC